MGSLLPYLIQCKNGVSKFDLIWSIIAWFNLKYFHNTLIYCAKIKYLFSRRSKSPSENIDHLPYGIYWIPTAGVCWARVVSFYDLVRQKNFKFITWNSYRLVDVNYFCSSLNGRQNGIIRDNFGCNTWWVVILTKVDMEMSWAFYYWSKYLDSIFCLKYKG